MKIHLLVLVAGLFLTACGLTGPEQSGVNKPAETVAATLAAGDRVIARWAKNSFYEGTVESVGDAKIKVKWDDGSSPSDIEKSEVFAMPKAGAKPDIKVGDMVLAKISTGTYWNGAEVTKIDGDVFAVKSIDGGQTANLSSEKILKVPATVIADLKEKSEANDFLKEAQAKKPTIPTDYKPKNGEQVLAEWSTNSWWQGKVQKVSGEKVTIAWEDGSKPSDVDLGKVMPFPKSADPKMPEPNQFVLVKPESGSKWVYAQTVATKDPGIEVKDQTGKTRSVKPGEFVVLN